jgi:hypothetical protein
MTTNTALDYDLQHVNNYAKARIDPYSEWDPAYGHEIQTWDITFKTWDLSVRLETFEPHGQIQALCRSYTLTTQQQSYAITVSDHLSPLYLSLRLHTLAVRL